MASLLAFALCNLMLIHVDNAVHVSAKRIDARIDPTSRMVDSTAAFTCCRSTCGTIPHVASHHIIAMMCELGQFACADPAYVQG